MAIYRKARIVMGFKKNLLPFDPMKFHQLNNHKKQNNSLLCLGQPGNVVAESIRGYLNFFWPGIGGTLFASTLRSSDIITWQVDQKHVRETSASIIFGQPRSLSGKYPCMWAWIAWVTSASCRRKTSKGGVAAKRYSRSPSFLFPLWTVILPWTFLLCPFFSLRRCALRRTPLVKSAAK